MRQLEVRHDALLQKTGAITEAWVMAPVIFLAPSS